MPSRSPRAPLYAAGWCVLAVMGGGGSACCLASSATDDEIGALIGQLGADDFSVREVAAMRLADLGATASDALLAAAESSPDLEVALKARWLVDALPLATPSDPPGVATALEKYARSDYEARVQLMHRLLRFDDDAGIEPLARIVRLERTASGSRIAAALLAREWHVGDPAWPVIAPKIAAGLGPSRRPAARFLRAVVEASRSPADPAAIEEATAAFALIARPGEGEPRATLADDTTDPSLGDAKTLRIFRRTLIELLASVGRRDAALAEAEQLFAACRGSAVEEELTAAEMAWLSDHGLPEAADLLADRVAADHDTFAPLTAYAVAVARRRLGDEAAAATVADRAADALARADGELSRRLQAAMLLARWGAADWAAREYESISGNPRAPIGEFALAGVLGAEFLNEQRRHADAAAVLRRVLDGREGDEEDTAQILLRLERDPRAIRSRMLFFSACDAATRGDAAAQRRLLEEALASYPKDVDALIAWYRLADGDPDRLPEARERVVRALEQIDEEIQAVPDDANGYNEYAWLVANTAGDIRTATRYAQRSLELSFDNSSYLDTLAHCRFAAGDLAGAVRTQQLAARQEPHNPTIRRNLDRFRTAAQP